MDSYRSAARKWLEDADTDDSFPVDFKAPQNHYVTLRDVWDNIQIHEDPKTNLNVCENLLVARAFLENTEPEYVLSEDDKFAANALASWVAEVVLPSEEFEGAWEEAQLATGEARLEVFTRFKIARLKATLGLAVLEQLYKLTGFEQIENPVNVVAALAAFTNPQDPWTTTAASSSAQLLLRQYEEWSRCEHKSLVALSGDVLSRFVKPSFSRTKTPAITSAGRKDMHPVKPPKFDPGIFDKGAKPWKYKDVYVVTVLSWVIQQYKPSDQAMIEAQFPLLIPAILSLIDDESLPYKALGCKLLNQLLIPLENAKSDILKRTNLDSVFEDALTPCLLSLPTLTPEDQSIHLLQSAYPALFSIIRTRYPPSPPHKQYYHPTPSHRKTNEQESQSRTNALTRVLRHSIISSYHHTSSPRPSEDTYISSYPHPKLSTLLLNQLTTATSELGIHTVVHLQELIPILTSTLTNPFGTAYLPLLIAAAECTRQLLLSAWPRVWRWRGEVLAGLCGCWLHLIEDEDGIKRSREEQKAEKGSEELSKLKQVLKECVGILKIVLEENADLDGAGEKVDVAAEWRQLVDVDERLAELFY
ncbi:hypothetical protein PRK78_006699 [Emydomyces testavorans]|uniref:Uncharacterized protein n=1 Tax=Emydomyces testavorans TaxID=2070801 RepID=A0AAF0DLX0_9EURO|nr:hypothetical protein PRK78_006699 [Emydomyces testavorans]